MALTRGATCVPMSSMLFISRLCGRVPALYFRSKRDRPSARTVRTIFVATVSGAPTTRAHFDREAGPDGSLYVLSLIHI